MGKQKTKIQKQGSTATLIILLILFFPIGVLYWLFAYKRIKTYEYN